MHPVWTEKRYFVDVFSIKKKKLVKKKKEFASLPIHEHEMSLYIFYLFLISHEQCYVDFTIQVLPLLS